MAVEMSWATYAAGTAGLVASFGALAWGSGAVVRVVVPAWRGAAARLAQVVVALSAGLAVAQLLGAVGLLSAGVVLGAEVAVGLGLGVGARSWSRRSRPGAAPPAGDPAPPPAPARRSPVELAAAGLALAVLAVQWTSHTLDAVGRGMVHPDTLWYHMPFSVRFAQEGGFPELEGVGYEAARWFPFDSHLLHTILLLPYDRDWLSPFVNLGWLALALLAAWRIGERRGAGPTAVAWTAVAAGLPILAATHPGQASTDMACGALLLAAVALLLDAEWEPGPLALAGLATGLAISTKVSLAVPVVVLVVVVAVVAARVRGWRAAVPWLVAVAATGSFWYLRNWVVAGTPLPWFDLPAPFAEAVAGDQPPSLLDARQLDRVTWDTIYRPGLDQALGWVWPLVLAVVLAGIALVARGRDGAERIVGAVVAAGVVGYLVTPLTAGITFGFNLRYLSPSILLAAAAAVPLVVPSGRVARAVTAVAGLALVAAGATVDNVERTPAWPDATPAAVVVVALAAGVVLGLRFLLARTDTGRTRLAAAAAIVVVLAVVGWPLQAHEADRRYVDADLLPSDVAAEALRTQRDQTVGLYGSVETYPLFGPDLSNDVELGATPNDRTCAGWRSFLDGRYDLVVISPFGLSPAPVPPVVVLADDPAAVPLARTDDTVVYRIDGPLDPGTCPA